MWIFQGVRQSRLFVPLVALLITVGFVSRAAPFVNQGGRLLRQWPTEDGYLMLTIARNIGIGKGMSIADGTIPTNGTQPLFNLLEAGGFALVGGDKQAGVAISLLLQLLISLVAALFVFLLARHALRDRTHNWEMAALATSLWYSSSIVIPHTMNCLETGLYVALILISVYVWYRDETGLQRSHFSWSVLKIGGLLGLTFWTRNDAVFLIAAITGWHTLLGLTEPKKQLRRRVTESFVIGITTLVIASPWLIYNKVNFGSIMPISGTAQSANASFGSNAAEIPSTLFEYTTIVLPIPSGIEKTWSVLVGTLLIFLVYVAIMTFAAFRMSRNERVLLYVVSTWAGILVVYYGLLFGAGHFVGRYLFPISPFMAIFTAAVIVAGLLRLGESVAMRRVLPLGVLSLLVLTIALNVRLYRLGSTHMHFQIVKWVEQNVAEDTWVGAVQTGTLGFFHDRTINLDGKVNPDALAARLEGRIPHYVVNQEFDDNGGQIEYLVDWVGIASWVNKKPLDTHFDLILEDPKNNLAVLQRKS